MRLTKEELQCFIPKNNLVLCEPAMECDKVKLGDAEIYIDPTFHPENHQPVIQKVISFNKNLIYGRKKQLVTMEHGQKGVPEYKINGTKNENFNFWYESTTEDHPIENSMPWKTEMEVRINDRVWVDFVSVFNAAKRNRLVYCENKTYYLIPYQDIYCCLNETELKICNGWIFIEPIEYLKTPEQQLAEKHGLSFIKKKEEHAPKDRYGIVRFIGKPVQEYLNLDQCDTDEISVGDIVLMKFQYNRRLESHYHLRFGDKMLIASRRPWVSAIIKEDLFPPSLQ